MGRSRLLVCALVLAVASGCEQTGILVEVKMSDALKAQLHPDLTDFDTLRIYVGTSTAEATQFVSSTDGFESRSLDEEDLEAGYRHLVEPDGDLGAIGPVMIAAAAGNDRDGFPFEIVGFAAASAPVAFGDGEVRLIELALEPDTGAQSGAEVECVRWGVGTQIAPPDDLDCDGAIGAADCDDRDPRRNQLDRDQDGVTSCNGDCMELPRFDLPWVSPAEVFPGSPFEQNGQVCTHVDYNCDGICGSASDDFDQSGATKCGLPTATEGTCAVTPADCSESFVGNQRGVGGTGEACNGYDDECDGFLPPPLPCLFLADGACHVGAVTCNELEGEYAGERDLSLDCKYQPFSEGHLPPTACEFPSDPACLETGDPIACMLEAWPAPRTQCTVNSRAPDGGQVCPYDRATINPPSGQPTSCQWFVVGGVDQAEWEVGFLDPNSTTGIPTASTTVCSPSLGARARANTPATRSILLLFIGADGVVQPVIVQLQGADLACTGAMVCSSAVMPL